MHDDLWKLAQTVESETIADRRWLHQHPEVGFHETKTAAYIANKLTELGLNPQKGVGGNGIKVVIQGSRPGPVIALRADMDALPISEETGLPFASQHPGMMHACGHETHVAMLLGTARALVRMSGDISGQVVLIFQPGEEVNPGGASLMVKDGVLDNPKVDMIFALHIQPLVPCGRLEFAAGPVMAAPDELKIIVHGKGGHGAYPHLAADPVLAAAEIVTSLQQIVSRRVPPFAQAVITIASIHGGTADNVITDQVVLGGTIRTMNPSLRDQIPVWITQVAEGVASAHGCRAVVEVERGYPPVINDDRATKIARQAAFQVVGPDCVGTMEPGMGGEDFAYYLQKVPGSIGRLGVAPPEGVLYPLHNSRLRVDERALVTGVAYWLALVHECGQKLIER